MRDARKLRNSRYSLYNLRDKGIIELVSRGIYRLAELPPMSSPDLVTVALRCPQAIICLVSALHFHEMTTQIPHSVSIAIPKRSRPPSIDHPPTTVYRFSAKSHQAGVDSLQLDGAIIKIFNPEKTLVDCFKFRNKIGMDIVLEAMKMYRLRKKINIKQVLTYAEICRVEKVILPYLEALI